VGAAWLLLTALSPLAMLLAGVAGWRYGQGRVAQGRRGRLVAGGAAVGLVVSGVLLRALVDRGDNAYADLELTGLLLLGLAVPFALAAVLPGGSARPLCAALALLWAGGALAAVALVASLIVIPGEGYRDGRIFRDHLLGLGVLLVAVTALSAAVLRGARRGPTSGQGAAVHKTS
jgi:hypothetical protein